jgi:cytochrome c oxidase cbb3-type subunit 2
MPDGSKVTVKLADTLENARKEALDDAKVVAADMKSQEVKDAIAAGNVPEIVALIAYLNRLK